MKQTSSLTTNATPSSERTRQRDRAGSEAAGDEIPGHDGDAEPRAEVVLVLDVIGARVRAQTRCAGVSVLALDGLQQRAERGAAVERTRPCRSTGASPTT